MKFCHPRTCSPSCLALLPIWSSISSPILSLVSFDGSTSCRVQPFALSRLLRRQTIVSSPTSTLFALAHFWLSVLWPISVYICLLWRLSLRLFPIFFNTLSLLYYVLSVYQSSCSLIYVVIEKKRSGAELDLSIS